MTNFEKYIKEMVSNIKRSESIDANYHWTEVVLVLEECGKYLKEKNKTKNLTTELENETK